MRMTLSDIYSVDEFADNDPVESRPADYPKIDIVVDALIEQEADRFDQFAQTLPTTKHRQVAWAYLYDKGRVTADEFEIPKRRLNAMKKEVKDAYKIFERAS